MAPHVPRMPVPGDVLLGRFRIESVIGEGGMGLVFGARQLSNDAAVAIKVLLPEASTHPEAIPRFINEARATTKIQSPHVVKIFEAGTLDIGMPFIVMELLDGSDLGAVIDKRGALPIPEAVDYVIQAADAVAEAHTLGIIHRDLKPSNLFVSSGRPAIVKVLDFGISKVSSSGPQSQALTATGAFLGSPHYMSPEQLKSARDVDARADIWSLGVILYELLMAKPPFEGGAFGELFIKVLGGEFAPMRAARPDIPDPLDQIVARCLRRNRDERFRDLPALAHALVPFASADGALRARGIGRPHVASPAQTAPAPHPANTPRAMDAARKFASTALMPDAPGALPPTGKMPGSNPNLAAPMAPGSSPGFAAPSSQPLAPNRPRAMPGSSGDLPQLPPSSPALPSFYAAGQAPQAAARSPWDGGGQKGPSTTVVAVAILAVVFAIVGAILIVVALRARGHSPSTGGSTHSILDGRK